VVQNGRLSKWQFGLSDQILSLSNSCYSDIGELRCIRPYIDSKTVSTIAASIVQSKLEYCNTLYYNLIMSHINRLQQIQNSLACTVVKAPIRFQSLLHCLKINERIEYKYSSHWPTKLSQPANLTTYTVIFVSLSVCSFAAVVANKDLYYPYYC